MAAAVEETAGLVTAPPEKMKKDEEDEPKYPPVGQYYCNNRAVLVRSTRNVQQYYVAA